MPPNNGGILFKHQLNTAILRLKQNDGDRKMDATIVIPTKNAGDRLKDCLTAVFDQKTDYQYEVICVDSGSKDHTLETIKAFPCRLYEIPPEDFGHGKTRNYGAALGTGTFIVFITQDAVPVNDQWLQHLIDAMKTDDEIAGGFGKHLPYPDCNLFDRRDLIRHFQLFGHENTIYQLNDPERYRKDPSYRQQLIFFSDNNACVRRSIFEKHPYSDVNFAEDQIWAKQMIELGYKKIYCPHAMVYHSHNYSLKTYLKRYYDDYKGYYDLHHVQITRYAVKLPWMYLKHTVSDCRYVCRQDLTFKEKCHWIRYAMANNYSRYVGGFLGGRYHLKNKSTQNKMDRQYSQQYEQRKQRPDDSKGDI